MTISEITKQFKQNKILPTEKFSIETRTIARCHDAIQNAQDKVLMLEAKVAMLEMEIEQINRCKQLREAIYG